MVVLAAGATAHLAGPGDRITVPMAQSTWVVIFMDTAMRAAQAGCGPFLTSHEGRAHAGWWWWGWGGDRPRGGRRTDTFGGRAPGAGQRIVGCSACAGIGKRGLRLTRIIGILLVSPLSDHLRAAVAFLEDVRGPAPRVPCHRSVAGARPPRWPMVVGTDHLVVAMRAVRAPGHASGTR